MQVTRVEFVHLAAELAAPMRSRGNVGYTEFFHTGSERQRLTAVELHTDSGIVGRTLLGGHAGQFVQEIATPSLLGQDPRGIRHWRRRIQDRLSACPEEQRRASRGAVNRLEFALWDLAAQGAGLPLFRYLGGTDPAVSVYAGGGSLCWNPLPLLEEETDRLLEQGFRAFKIKVGHGPEEDAAIVRTLRRRAPQARIMVDANRAYDLPGALQFARVLEEEQAGWFEEPFVYDDPALWRSLRTATPVRVSGGEGFHQLRQVSEALRDGIVEILQCDAGGFGLEGLLSIASLAAEADVALTPHSCNSAIGFVVACHLQRALPNHELQEFETFDNPFIHSIFAEPFALQDGCVVLPEAPGLGVTWNRETIEQYRVVQ
ncbi:MAG: mandelate racemase/muconate lactonizing enzyme family protein [Armatimonadetes bacterium]|nr:mandelate racemase/muconate lactonizing enzyme family protein [Armatimonadota bacterium]